MAHRVRKCVNSPAWSIAAAGGKSHVSKRHALFVAAYAKKNRLSLQGAAAQAGLAVDALLRPDPPATLEMLAQEMGTSVTAAAGVVEALIAFGYLKA